MKKLILILTLITVNIFTLDTIETFDLGFTDFEYYNRTSDLTKNNKTFTNEIHIGAGITPVFSSHISLSSEKTDNYLPVTSYSFGFILTVLNTKNTDIDFYGELDSSYNTLIGLELNYDLEDELKYLGFYLRPEIEFNNDYKIYKLLLGTYYSLNTSIQLLAEFDVYKIDSQNLETGNIAFGINYTLYDSIELINEFSIDIPHEDETTSYSVMIGFLATLP